MMNKRNIFAAADGKTSGNELFETLCAEKNVLIERIISAGECTPEGTWLDQNKHEWVILIQGKATILFETDGKHDLIEGDYLFIPSGCRHRVEHTSTEPQCVWLAVLF